MITHAKLRSSRGIAHRKLASFPVENGKSFGRNLKSPTGLVKQETARLCPPATRPRSARRNHPLPSLAATEKRKEGTSNKTLFSLPFGNATIGKILMVRTGEERGLILTGLPIMSVPAFPGSARNWPRVGGSVPIPLGDSEKSLSSKRETPQRRRLYLRVVEVGPQVTLRRSFHHHIRELWEEDRIGGRACPLDERCLYPD